MEKSLNPKNFSLLPSYQNDGQIPKDGLVQKLSNFCKNKFNEKCKAHYSKLSEGANQCPYGFSTYNFKQNGRTLNWTGIKIKGHSNLNSVQNRESTRGFKVYKEEDLDSLKDSNYKLVEYLNYEFDRKIEKEKKTLEDAKSFTNNSFHEIRPLNAEIKAAVNKAKSVLGSLKDQLGSDYLNIQENLNTVAHCSEVMTSRMDLRDFLLNPNSTNLGTSKRISLKKEIKTLNNIFKTTLRKDSLKMNINLNEKYAIKTFGAFKIALFVLIENAIKYSPSKIDQDIDVSLAIESKQILLSITSFGPKIEDKELESIFEPFIRGANTKDYEGNGIGLFAAKSILAQLEMSINIKQATKFITFNEQCFHETTFTIVCPITLFRENK